MSPPSDLPPPMNHVFVDFENVQKIDPALIGNKAISFTLLLGASQTKLNLDLVEKMLEHAASVELIRLKSSGKNALDFTLSYYLGRKVLADPTAYFHVITKDKGYDPLIEHLRSRHINARRHDDFSTLTFSHKPKVEPAAVQVQLAVADEALGRVLEHLRKNATNRPKKKTTLLRHVKSLLGKEATEAKADQVFEELRKVGHLSIEGKDAVTYHV